MTDAVSRALRDSAHFKVRVKSPVHDVSRNISLVFVSLPRRRLFRGRGGFFILRWFVYLNSFFDLKASCATFQRDLLARTGVIKIDVIYVF